MRLSSPFPHAGKKLDCRPSHAPASPGRALGTQSKPQMAHFQRKLPEHALRTTRTLASSGSWMGDLLAEWAPSGTCGSLRLAVRNGYLNFYRLGQSVSKVDFPQRRETATNTVHHKYVIPEEDGQRYLKIHPAEGLDDAGKTCEWGGSTMLASWIAEAACHADDEKKRIDALLDHSPRVIDLEIALPARQRGDSAPRIDIAALEDPSDGHPARVVFWEVKRINDARLRSICEPKVLEQLRAYEDYVLRSNRQVFEDAYRNVCCILSQFHDIASHLWDSPRPLDRLVRDVAKGAGLEVDTKPRLLVINDECEKSNWDDHLRKLRNRLGDRVHLVHPDQSIPRAPR